MAKGRRRAKTPISNKQKALVAFNSAVGGVGGAAYGYYKTGGTKTGAVLGAAAGAGAYGYGTRRALQSYNNKTATPTSRASLTKRQAGWTIGVTSALGAQTGALTYAGMKAYNLTSRRRAALRKAQQASARKRRKG